MPSVPGRHKPLQMALDPIDEAPSGADPPDLATRGPWAVGVRELEIEAPATAGVPERLLPVEVWYPAAADDAAAPEASHALGLPHPARIGLPPASGADARPLLVFSHGNSGLRQQSTFLTTHLASWGFVVAAPDHVGNTFVEMMAIEDEAERKAAHRRARAQRPLDQLAVLQALLDAGRASDALPRLDPTRVGALGHSFGGWTTLKLPRLDPRVRALCCLAPAAEPFVGRAAFAPDELPLPGNVETLVLAAHDEVLVDLEQSIRPLHARLGPRAQLEVIDRADHFHFCDGIELLHGLHLRTPRPDLPRAPLPYEALRAEAEMQRLLQERVTHFFRAAWAPGADGDRSGSAEGGHDRAEPAGMPERERHA